jgi:hypothetical protein
MCNASASTITEPQLCWSDHAGVLVATIAQNHISSA